MAMIYPSTREAAGAFLEAARRMFPISGAMLFGSRARHDNSPESDADLAVFLKGDVGSFVGTKLAMADIAYDVLLEKGILIQPLPVWELEWQHPERYPNPRLLANIRRDGIAL
ncbi:antitoxin ChpS [Rhizobium aquaticum]|uniref:Antitoxin ChpS n=1 Tax=Rhizobium aquaticum TaxID=1549636 RepID=A0ABV2J184_9HYPH